MSWQDAPVVEAEQAEQPSWKAAPVVSDAQAVFDPEGKGYDYNLAIESGGKPDSTGHWGSLDPRTGRVLKGKNHPTFSKTIEAEAKLGNEITKGADGFYYSKPKALSSGPAFIAGQTAAELWDGTRRFSVHFYGGMARGEETLLRPLGDAIDFYAHKMGVSADKKSVITYLVDGAKEIADLTPEAVGPETKAAKIMGAVTEGGGSLLPQLPAISTAIAKLGPAGLAVYNALTAAPSGDIGQVGKAAIEGLALQGVLHVTSPLKTIIKAPLQAGVFGGMAAASGASPEDIAAQAILGGVLTLGGRDIPGWAKKNPAKAVELAGKETPSRKDFEQAGLPRMPAAERARIAAELKRLDEVRQNVTSPEEVAKPSNVLNAPEPAVGEVPSIEAKQVPYVEQKPPESPVDAKPPEGMTPEQAVSPNPPADMSRDEMLSELKDVGIETDAITGKKPRNMVNSDLRKLVEVARVPASEKPVPVQPVAHRMTRQMIKDATRKELQDAIKNNKLGPVNVSNQVMRSALKNYMEDTGNIKKMTSERRAQLRVQYSKNMASGKMKAEWNRDEEASKHADLLMSEGLPEGTEVVLKGNEDDFAIWKVSDVLVPDFEDLKRGKLRYRITDEMSGQDRIVSSDKVNIVEPSKEGVSNDVQGKPREVPVAKGEVPEGRVQPAGIADEGARGNGTPKEAAKESGELIADSSYKLIQDQSPDNAAIMAERAKAEAAKADQEKRQGNLFAGPGAAAAGSGTEFFEGTGASHAYSDAMRESLGRQPRTPSEKRTDEELISEVSTMYDKDPSVGRDLIESFAADPRKVPSDRDSITLQRESVIAEQAINEARTKNDAAAEDIAQARWDNIENILDRGGSEAGRALRVRRLMMDADFNVSRMESRVKKDQKGKPLSDEQKADITRLKAEYDATQKELNANLERLKKENAAKDEEIANAVNRATAAEEFDRQVQDMLQSAVKKKPFSKRMIDYADKLEAEALASMRARTTKMSAGVDPTVLVDMGKLGTSYIIRGAGEFGAWSVKMREAFKGFDIEKHLRDIYNKSWKDSLKGWREDATKPSEQKKFGKVEKIEKKEQTQAQGVKELMQVQIENGVRDLETATKNVVDVFGESKIEITPEKVMELYSDYPTDPSKVKKPSADILKKVASDFRNQSRSLTQLDRMAKELQLYKIGSTQQKPSDRARELERKVASEMKRLGITTTDPATQRASALTAIKSRLENQIADLDKAIETHKRMTVNRGTIAYDVEAKALQVKRDARREQYDAIFPPEPLTDQQRLDIAIKQAEQSVNDWNRKVKDAKSGKFGPKEKESKPLPASKKLDELIAQREKAKVEVTRLKELANPKRSPEQIAIDAKRKRMDSTIAKMEAMMVSGDFSKKSHAIVNISGDEAAMKSQVKLERVKIDFTQMREAARWSSLSKVEQGAEMATAIYDTVRNSAYSADDSFLGRQGWFYSMSHPIEWFKAGVKSVKAFRQGQSMKFGQEFIERENHRNGLDDRMKLEYNKPDGTGNYGSAEDQFRLNLTKDIPLLGKEIQVSGNAYATAANVVRGGFADLILSGTKTGREIMKNPKNLTPDQARFLEDIGWGVNALTGRGTMKHAEAASRAFGAPRFIKAAFDTLIFRPIWHPKSKEAKLVFAKEYARAAGTVTAMYIIYDLFADDKNKVDWDPRSTKWGAMKIGGINQYFNPLVVIRPQLNILARLISGQTKSYKGEIVNLRESNLWFATEAERKNKVPYGSGIWSTVGRYVQGKLHPGLSAVGGAVSGTDFNGRPQTPVRAILSGLVPITPGQIYNAYAVTDPVSATGVSAVNFFGGGVTPDYNDPAVMKQESTNDADYQKRLHGIILSGTDPKATPEDVALAKKQLAGMSSEDRHTVLRDAIKAREGKLEQRHKNGKFTPYGKRLLRLNKL